MENNKQPFSWELYQTGKYDAVYRDDDTKITTVTPDPLPSDFYKFIAEDEEGRHWAISADGRLFNKSWHDDENDVMLIAKATA